MFKNYKQQNLFLVPQPQLRTFLGNVVHCSYYQVTKIQNMLIYCLLIVRERKSTSSIIENVKEKRKMTLK